MTKLNYISNIPYELEKNRKLKNICMQALKEKYANQVPEDAQRRLNWELKMTAFNQYSSYYLEMYDFIKQKEIKPWNISFEGTTGASLICYLCGITQINPMNHKMPLYPEFFMGYQGNKFPCFGMKMCETDKTVEQLTNLVNKTLVYPNIEEIITPEQLFLLEKSIESFPICEREIAKEVIEMLKPKTFAELVKAVGLIYSGVKAQQISCREDLYEMILACGIDRKTAFCITESVRRGQGVRMEWQVLLFKKGFSKECLKECNETKYLCSRAQAIEVALQNLRMVYYKNNYPKIFEEVCCWKEGEKNMRKPYNKIEMEYLLGEREYEEIDCDREIPRYNRKEYYSVEQIRELLDEAKRFSASGGAPMYYEPIINKIVSSIEWLLSFDYMEEGAKEEVEHSNNDKYIWRVLQKWSGKNCMEACEYVDAILGCVTKQELSDYEQARLRVRMVDTVMDMISNNDTLFFIKSREKKILAELCMELFDEAEKYLLMSDVKFEKKKELFIKMRGFYIFMYNKNYFNSFFYQREWKQVSCEKIEHYQRLVD